MGCEEMLDNFALCDCDGRAFIIRVDNLIADNGKEEGTESKDTDDGPTDQALLVGVVLPACGDRREEGKSISDSVASSE